MILSYLTYTWFKVRYVEANKKEEQSEPLLKFKLQLPDYYKMIFFYNLLICNQNSEMFDNND